MKSQSLLFGIIFTVTHFSLGATPSSSQQPPPEFRVEVNFIEIDAIVVDSDGNFVGDLKQEDFEILEDGLPQEIATFRLIDIPLELESRAESRIAPIEPDVRTNESASEGRLYVLVLDDLHTAPKRSSRVRQIAREFIERWVGENDLAAVTHTSGRADASRDFNDNRRALLEAVDGFMGRGLRSMSLERIELLQELDEGVDPDMVAATMRTLDSEHGYQARKALAHLRSVTEFLGEIRGRKKTILFISEGIGYDIYDFVKAAQAETVAQEAREAIGSAGLSNVTIYALGVRGLSAGQDDLVSIAGMPSSIGERPNLNARDTVNPAIQDLIDDSRLGLSSMISEEIRRSHDSLRVLSSETGGIAVVNENDLGEGLKRIAIDASRYYLLGYYPKGDPVDGEFRPVEVRVGRPGVSVRSRKGYIASKIQPSNSVGSRVIGVYEPVTDVLESPLPVAGLPIRVFATPIELAREKVYVPVVVETSIEGFSFVERDGKLHDRVDISVVALNEQGDVAARENNKFNLALRPEIRDRMLEEGFRSMAVLDLPPAVYQLRIGAYENGAGRTGSVFIDVEVPEPRELAMSGLILCSRKDNVIPIAAKKGDKERVPFSPSTRRRFAADDELVVYAEIHAPKAQSPSRANLSVRTVVRRFGGEVVSQSEETKEGQDASPTNFIHQVRYDLSELSPGKYTLEVQAREVDGSEQVGRMTVFEILDSPRAASPVPLEPGKPPLYLELIDTYRGGNLEGARRLIVTWSEDAVSRAVKELRSSTDDAKVFKAATLLHTDVVIHYGRDLTEKTRALHIETAERLLRFIPNERVFEYEWLLTMACYNHGVDLSESKDYLKKAKEIFPDDAEMLLAAGSVEEASVWIDDDRGKLEDAEKYYRRTLQADSGLAEAHLRLGRVLQQRGDKREEEALQELNWVVENSADSYLLYLANLFLGDLHKAKGRLGEAVVSYRAAVRAEPRWQVAYLSLSQALRASGDRLEARDVAREALMLPVFDPEHTEGRRLYDLGQFNRVPGMLDRMREKVGQ